MTENIPNKDEWVKKQFENARWDRMGYWERCGKGSSRVDTSPGANYGLWQIILIFVGFIFLFADMDKYTGTILIAIGIILGILKNRCRKKYLEKKYDEYFNSSLK
ncbi:MAG: hypothetical protein WC430_03765 [Patescibacteria group bacterium]